MVPQRPGIWTIIIALSFDISPHLFDGAEAADEADEDDEEPGDDEDVGHRHVELVAQQHLDVRLVRHRPDPHAEHQEAAGLQGKTSLVF